MNNSRVAPEKILTEILLHVSLARISIQQGKWLSDPVYVLVVYLLLFMIQQLGILPLLQVGLAAFLLLFGSGLSVMALLFPRPSTLDEVERWALAGALSLAVGGILGFMLARSPWGLKLPPVMVATGLFHVGCALIVWLRQRAVETSSAATDSGDHAGSRSPYRTWSLLGPRLEDLFQMSTVTLVLAVILFSGSWVLGSRLLATPDPGPAMTEFYLLDNSGLAANYPRRVAEGETFAVTYGIHNLEGSTALYEVHALAEDQVVGRSRLLELHSGEIYEARIEVELQGQTNELSKIDFVLYRNQQPYRSLYLWLTVDAAADARDDPRSWRILQP
jgi:uncharacterized membrane protein